MTRLIKGQSDVSLILASLKKQKVAKLRRISFLQLAVELVVKVEKKIVNRHSQCNPYNMLSTSELKAKSPDIMNCGLKATINRQGDKVVERE
jgi:hypothetical protein